MQSRSGPKNLDAFFPHVSDVDPPKCLSCDLGPYSYWRKRLDPTLLTRALLLGNFRVQGLNG